MDHPKTHESVVKFKAWKGGLNSQQRLAFHLSVLLGILMVLFPPRTMTVNTGFGPPVTNSLGYGFILDNPANNLGMFASAASIHLDLVRLIVQFAVLGVASYYILRYLGEAKSGS